MKTLNDSELDEYLWGRGLVEIEISDPVAEAQVFALLKKRGGFIATRRGTYRVSRETLKFIRDQGHLISETEQEET